MKIRIDGRNIHGRHGRSLDIVRTRWNIRRRRRRRLDIGRRQHHAAAADRRCRGFVAEERVRFSGEAAAAIGRGLCRGRKDEREGRRGGVAARREAGQVGKKECVGEGDHAAAVAVAAAIAAVSRGGSIGTTSPKCAVNAAPRKPLAAPDTRGRRRRIAGWRQRRLPEPVAATVTAPDARFGAPASSGKRIEQDLHRWARP